jgi:hypothetical protein
MSFKLAWAAAVALGVVSVQPAVAAHVSCGVFTATTIRPMPGTETTSLQSFTQLVTLQMENAHASCVHVQFAVDVRAPSPKSAQVRITVDGAAAGFPNFVNLTTSGTGFDERAMTFVIPEVVAGEHTIGVEFRSADGTPVSLRNGILRAANNRPL